MAGSSYWGTEQQKIMAYGDEINIGGYDVNFRDTNGIIGPNYTAVRGAFDIRKNGKIVATLEPEARLFSTPPMPTTEAAIYSTLMGDLFIVIGEANNKTYDQWAVRLYYKPLQTWLWGGVVVMVFGGFISLSDRRFRMGAAKKKIN